MSRRPREHAAQRLDRADRRMAPGGRMWSEAPIRPIRNRKMLLPGVGAAEPVEPVALDASYWFGNRLVYNSTSAPSAPADMFNASTSYPGETNSGAVAGDLIVVALHSKNLTGWTPVTPGPWTRIYLDQYATGREIAIWATVYDGVDDAAFWRFAVPTVERDDGSGAFYQCHSIGIALRGTGLDPSRWSAQETASTSGVLSATFDDTVDAGWQSRMQFVFATYMTNWTAPAPQTVNGVNLAQQATFAGATTIPLEASTASTSDVADAAATAATFQTLPLVTGDYPFTGNSNSFYGTAHTSCVTMGVT